MKFVVCCALLVLVLAAANAQYAGVYIPKAFYTLDAEGKKSTVHAVSPHTANYLRRLRRSPQYVSSSSSSSSVSSNGGPVYFSSQQTQHAGGDPYGQTDIQNRFGGSSSTGTTGSSGSGSSVPVASGHYVQTTGVIHSDGRVQYQTNKGVLH